MDTHVFDHLTRLVAARTTRRAGLGVLLAAIAGRAPDIAAAGRAGALCRRMGAGCAHGGQCCTGYCATGRATPRRQRFRCACPASTTLCGSACIDTTTDDAHCGACNAPCGADRTCIASECVCNAPLTACDNTCIDTDSDVDHCGGCNAPCGPGETCVSGACCCGAGGSCGDFNTCIDNECHICAIEPGAVGCYRTVEDTFQRFQLGQWQGNVACTSSAWCAANYLQECTNGTYTCVCATGFSTSAQPDMWFYGPSYCAWALV